MSTPPHQLSYDKAWNADPRDAWATITLVVCAAILSVQRFNGVDYDHLIADYRGMPGSSWKFVTSALLHGGWMHLVFNLYWTFKFGVLLEAMLGLGLFSATVVALAFGSSAAQWALGGPGIGLSGIGYGLFGLLWALDRWHPDCRGVLDRRVAELFGAWFLLCILASWYDVMPIANVAHGAGFLMGALGGWALSANGLRRLARSVALTGFLALVAVASLAPVRHVLNRSEAYSYELFDRGYAALQAEDWERGVALYETLVAREPDLPEAWNNLGVAQQNLSMFGRAQESFARSRELEKARAEEMRGSAEPTGDLFGIPSSGDR